MRQYRVFVKGEEQPLTISADDVNLVSADGPSQGVFLNFWQYKENSPTQEDVTVAAVPLGEVRYVVSV